MNETQKEDLMHIVIACMKLQSAIHSLDKVEGETNWTKKQKADWKVYIRYNLEYIKKLESAVNEITVGITSAEQSQNYSDCVEEFDKLGETIRLV